jgi:hypothetical protein
MSIRGIRSVYSNPTDSVRSNVYRDAISINLATTDVTITAWMRVLGATADGVRGQVPFQVFDSLNALGAMIMTTSPASPYSMMLRVREAAIDSDYGSFSVSDGEDVFYVLTWDHSTATWSAYISKNGVASMGSPATNGGGGATGTMDKVLFFGGQFGSFWGWNVEGTDPKIWVGRILNTTEMLTEKAVDSIDPAESANVAACYKLPDASTLGNSSGSFATLLVQGSISNALALNPSDLTVGGGGGGGGQTASKYGFQNLDNGFGPAPAAGLQGVLQS